jgi:serine/threonine protein kinase
VNYKTNKILGEGKNAIIYLATDITNNRLVAMKAIEVQEDPIQIDFVKNEIACLKRLQEQCSKYVLCYIDSDIVTLKENDMSYYIIITKFLEDYITWKEFKKKYKTNVKDKIKQALEFIHSKNIYHGDLHDDNIMIHPETLDVRIIDFGYCRLDSSDPGIYELDNIYLK